MEGLKHNGNWQSKQRGEGICGAGLAMHMALRVIQINIHGISILPLLSQLGLSVQCNKMATVHWASLSDRSSKTGRVYNPQLRPRLRRRQGSIELGSISAD